MWCPGSAESDVASRMEKSSVCSRRILLAGLALLMGCRSKPEQDVPAPVTKPSHVETVRDAASKTDSGDISCKHAWECPDLPVTSSCWYACEEGSCRLWYKKVAKLGAGPCYGNSLGEGTLMDTSGAVPFRIACDLSAGLYCDMKSHRCIEIKARGARCERDDECGAYDRCMKGRCSAGAELGAKCQSTHCEKDAFCSEQSGRCERILDLGAACKHDTDCRSGACNGHCVQPHDPVPCPVPMPTWNELDQ